MNWKNCLTVMQSKRYAEIIANEILKLQKIVEARGPLCRKLVLYHASRKKIYLY